MLSEDQRAGILITVAVHLTVIIFLLLTSIHTIAHRGGEMIVIDFDDEAEVTQHDTPESDTPELTTAERMSIAEMIAARNIQGVDVHNITTSRNADARGTDADKLYDDADRLAEALKNGQSLSYDDDEGTVPSGNNDGKKQENKQQQQSRAYSGASVLSWSLDGRQARHLPVPAYKCYGGGTVTVIIRVNSDGRVTDASIDTATSSSDPCLKKQALAFAKQARFSASASAPNPQTGDIIYQFIAQ